MRLILYSRLKTELTRDSKLAVRFLFFKEPYGSQASNLTSKKPPGFAWRSFQQEVPSATNLSLGTSPNYRYRDY
jgi:hypothetical protein